MGEKIETGELKKWQHDLDEVLLRAPDQVRGVVQRAAFQIKKDAQSRVRGLKHAPVYPYAISYDTRELAGPTFVAEIGPDKQKRQGALGNILEYGTVKNPPRPHMAPAADAEKPKFERALGDLAARLLEEP
ncbi:hypothetical protein ACFYUR_22085 [Micromonospora haikouensis]|uniref:hypothetical protein n=1 Tax=Micromonospora haikouensis TaxID=686309 RepID=UPI0036C85ED1